MRTVAEHAAAVRGVLSSTPVTPTPLAEAAGLVLGADLVADLHLPPFANSAMDGYAVRAAEAVAGARLPVSQEIPAGRTDVQPLHPGTAARIMTGAEIPDGADAIVPVERTDGGVEQVTFTESADQGRHIRDRGSDVAAGSTVLAAGTVIRPPQIGLAAALGHDRLPVHQPLRVLVLSTGSELVGPGKPLQRGQIYESNAAMLAAACAAIGARPRIAHFVSDDVDEFGSSLAGTVGDADLIVTSGGVSAGAYEVVKDALAGRGVEFVKVAMQPGMPQGCGIVELDGGPVPVVTLPGNPVSSYVSFEVFLRPAILAAMGHAAVDRPRRTLPLAEPLTSVAGKRQFRRSVVDPGTGTVRAFGGPGSHLLGWLAGADSLLVIGEDSTALDAGDPVEVWELV